MGELETRLWLLCPSGRVMIHTVEVNSTRDKWLEIDDYLIAKGLHVGKATSVQITGGRHAATHGHLSNHYFGTARDYGIHDSDAYGIARHLEFVAAQAHGPVAELFFAPLGIWYKNGRIVENGALVIGGHQDHCHVALHPGRRLF
jgi:hypothetical protein